MKLVERTAYLDELKDLLLTPDIKVITGVRRSGKSKLMDALAVWLQANDPQANIIHVNFNLTDFTNSYTSLTVLLKSLKLTLNHLTSI